MSQKAKSLVEIMNLFKPMALTAENADFYQKTSDGRDGKSYQFYEGLYGHIEDSDTNARLLVIGHGGCGKSTELHMLKEKLSQNDFSVIYIEAQDNLDLYSFTYIDICILIVERMAQYAEEKGLSVDSTLLSSFENALSTKITREYWGVGAEAGVETSVSVSASIPIFLNMIAKITSSLKAASGFKEEFRKEVTPQMSDIVAALNAFVKHISEQTGWDVVIIVDGLEKCLRDRVQDLFDKDIAAILGIKAHLVMACPIAISRSADAVGLSTYFTSEHIPMIKTHHKDGKPYDKGIKVIRELILKRADSSFFEDDVLETIISSAGGSLRDTCYLLSDSAFEAKMSGKQTVDMDSVKLTLRKLSNEVFFRVDSKLFPKVGKIYQGDHLAMQDPELSELLYCGAVFEYNGDRWVDLHPLLREYIKNHPEVLPNDSINPL